LTVFEFVQSRERTKSFSIFLLSTFGKSTFRKGGAKSVEEVGLKIAPEFGSTFSKGGFRESHKSQLFLFPTDC
jgi:hypothetical protein